MLQIHPKTSKIYWSTMFDTTNQLIFFWKISYSLWNFVQSNFYQYSWGQIKFHAWWNNKFNKIKSYFGECDVQNFQNIRCSNFFFNYQLFPINDHTWCMHKKRNFSFKKMWLYTYSGDGWEEKSCRTLCTKTEKK